MFRIGDRIAVIWVSGIAYLSVPPGSTGVISGELEACPSPVSGGIIKELSHRVQMDDGQVTWLIPRVMRKLDDDYDGNKVTSWDACPFKPSCILFR